jgi:hypothetical protein
VKKKTRITTKNEGRISINMVSILTKLNYEKCTKYSEIMSGESSIRDLSYVCMTEQRMHPTKYIYTYIEHHSVCLLVGIGTPPTPLPQARVPSPPYEMVGGHTRLRLRVWGSPHSDDGRKA